MVREKAKKQKHLFVAAEGKVSLYCQLYLTKLESIASQVQLLHLRESRHFS